MKKLLLIPIVLFFALSATAQESQRGNRGDKNRSSQQMTPEQRAEMRTKRMTEELSLTKEQQEKIYQITLEQSKKQGNYADRSEPTRETRKAEMLKSQEDINKLLTSEQKDKWSNLQKSYSNSRNNDSKSNRDNMKRRGEMIKKADSTQSRRPAKKSVPASKLTPAKKVEL